MAVGEPLSSQATLLAVGNQSGLSYLILTGIYTCQDYLPRTHSCNLVS